MPTYQYRCTACGRETEAVQAFTDAALTECPHCGGLLRKVYGAVGVVFKGSGFYRNDSRKTTTSGEAGGAKEPVKASASKESSGSGESGSAGSGSKDAGSKDAGPKGSGSKPSGSKDTGAASSAGSKPAGSGSSGGKPAGSSAGGSAA